MRNQAAVSPLNQTTHVMHALADPSRVRLLAACLDTERCVCQLVALVDDLSNASISKHLGTLKGAGLLASRREGRWVHYRVPDHPSPVVHDAIELVRSHATSDDALIRDARTLARIDTIDPTDLARMQREGCCPTFTPQGTEQGSQP